MQFKRDMIPLIIAGKKTQTRRIVKPEQVWWANGYENDAPVEITDVRIVQDIPYSTRKIYEVGQTYAVQPGPGQPGVYYGWRHNGEPHIVWDGDEGMMYANVAYQPLRIRLLAITRADVRAISQADATAEGFASPAACLTRWALLHDYPAFKALTKHGASDFMARPAEKYQAWALTFEVVK